MKKVILSVATVAILGGCVQEGEAARFFRRPERPTLTSVYKAKSDSGDVTKFVKDMMKLPIYLPPISQLIKDGLNEDKNLRAMVKDEKYVLRDSVHKQFEVKSSMLRGEKADYKQSVFDLFMNALTAVDTNDKKTNEKITGLANADIHNALTNLAAVLKALEQQMLDDFDRGLINTKAAKDAKKRLEKSKKSLLDLQNKAKYLSGAKLAANSAEQVKIKELIRQDQEILYKAPIEVYEQIKLVAANKIEFVEKAKEMYEDLSDESKFSLENIRPLNGNIPRQSDLKDQVESLNKIALKLSPQLSELLENGEDIIARYQEVIDQANEAISRLNSGDSQDQRGSYKDSLQDIKGRLDSGNIESWKGISKKLDEYIDESKKNVKAIALVNQINSLPPDGRLTVQQRDFELLEKLQIIRAGKVHNLPAGIQILNQHEGSIGKGQDISSIKTIRRLASQ